MGYVEFEYFSSLYNEITESEFTALEWEARRIVDAHTAGVDNVRKLRIAYPIDEDDAEAVKRCMCKLIKTMHDITTAEAKKGFTTREDGSIVSGVVSSVSSGSESISYATSGATSLDAAVASLTERNKLYSGIVREYLSGVSDANGVNLLYMGRYPYVS